MLRIVCVIYAQFFNNLIQNCSVRIFQQNYHPIGCTMTAYFEKMVVRSEISIFFFSSQRQKNVEIGLILPEITFHLIAVSFFREEQFIYE